MNNKLLNIAKYHKHDEFYTPYSAIEKELKYYWSFFKGKIIEVSRIANIPSDYEGVMGVPLSLFCYDYSDFTLEELVHDNCRINDKKKYKRFFIKKK